LNPDVTDEYSIKMTRPRVDEIVSFLVGERDFDQERVEKTARRLEGFTRVDREPLTDGSSRRTKLQFQL